MNENGILDDESKDTITPCFSAYQLDRDKISSLWRLTPRECDIALQLLSGKSLKNASISLGISYETTRWNVKNILAKVNVHSQIQLVIKLAKATEVDYIEHPLDIN